MAYWKNIGKVIGTFFFVLIGVIVIVYFVPIDGGFEENYEKKISLVNDSKLGKNLSNISSNDFESDSSPSSSSSPSFVPSSSSSHYPITLPPFSNCYGINEKEKKTITNIDDCIEFDYDVFEKIGKGYSHFKMKELLTPKTRDKGQRYYIIPNNKKIPRKKGKNIGYCGAGYLFFDIKKDWWCFCKYPRYFGGDTCDDVQEDFIREYKCVRVADDDDHSNSDISTFDPVFTEFCSECAHPETHKPALGLVGYRGPYCVPID